MSLQTKSFVITKGDTLERLTQFLENEIGLNAYLIKSIKAVSLNATQTQITLLYERYNSNIIESIAPREGAIFSSDLASNTFDIRFLFNDPIDYRSIVSGTFLIDGVGLDTSRVSLDPGCNDYFLKVLASGASFQTEDFHTYQISTASLKRRDGSSIDYGPVGGYIFHTLSNAHIGDYAAPYVTRRRGKISMAVVRLPKGIGPQQAITEFLNQRQISDDRLIAYTPVSSGPNSSDVYFIYISKLEPQIISGFPLNNSLLPDVSAPGKVTFVFNTRLDKAKLTSTDGLFSIESDYATSVLVPASDVTLLDDLHTVEIDTSTYFTSQKVYSIIARPGILGLDGLSKQKPEQWTIHISAYEPGIGGEGVSQAAYDFLSGETKSHIEDSALHYEQTDISITYSQISDPPPYTPTSAYDYLSGTFSNHSGIDSIHFRQTDIDISVSQINDLPSYTLTTAYNYLSGEFDSHSGETDIHYTQSAISISVGQISDLPSYTLTTAYDYLSGEFDSHSGETNIHYTQDQIEITTTQINSEATPSGEVLTSDGIGNTFWKEVSVGGGGDVTTAQYNYLSGEFTSHSGDPDIHFTQAEISIGYGQISDLPSYTLTSAYNYLSGEHTSHSGDLTIHYTQSEILISTSQITDLPSYPLSSAYDYLSGEYTTHASNSSIHFTEASIDHTAIDNIGSNSHSAIDAHIANASLHFDLSSIEITQDQISDLGDYATTTDFSGAIAAASGASGLASTVYDLFTGHTGDSSIHGGGGGGGAGVLRFAFHARADGDFPLTNQVQAAQLLSSNSRNITIVDLAEYTQTRLIARVVTASASANSPHIYIGYSTGFTTSAGAYSDVGTSHVSVSLAVAEPVASSWIPLAPGAIADNLYLACIQSGGDGAADPRIGNIYVEFK